MTRADGTPGYASTGSGTAVLLIQGVGVIGTGWRPQVESLSARFRTITFDNRGIGASARGDTPLTIEIMADDALSIADAAGAGRFHLVGHSMGGLIAQRVALEAPQRVKSLSLLCTFADGRDASGLSPRLMWLGIRTRVGTRAMRRNGMLRMVMPPAFLQGVDRGRLAADLGALFGRDLADQPPIIGEQLRAMSRYSAAASLGRLAAIPTLVVSAAHDPIAPPRLGRALAAGIHGARYIELPDAGHAAPIQCAGEINALLAAHLSAAESGAAA
jgi:pimeloyl-ACP methyl ester carboxylesterase